MGNLIRAARVVFAVFVMVATCSGAESQTQTGEFLSALRGGDPEKLASVARVMAQDGNTRAQFVMALLEDSGAGVPIDHVSARERLQKVVETEPLARFYLSAKFRLGFGVPKNSVRADALVKDRESPVVPEELKGWFESREGFWLPRFSIAFRWMKEGALLGNKTCQVNLLEAYTSPLWTRPDEGRRMVWAGELAKAKVPRGLAVVSELLQLSDEAGAASMRLEAAKGGDTQACYGVAEALEEKETSNLEALTWYRKAESQGDWRALKRLMQVARYGGLSEGPDYATFKSLCEKGAALGDPWAVNECGDMYYDGLGVEKSPARAVVYYEEAAACGVARASRNWGRILRDGLVGERNTPRALELFEQAVKDGYPAAWGDYGETYEYGLGVEKDLKKAFRYWEKAARDGDSNAQNHVGWMLREAIGVERDDEEAYSWFTLAVKNGLDFAKSNLAFHLASGRGVKKDLRAAFQQAQGALRTQKSGFCVDVLGDLMAGCYGPISEFKPEVEALLADASLGNEGGALSFALLAGLDGSGTETFAGEDAFVKRLEASTEAEVVENLAWRHILGLRGASKDLSTTKALINRLPVGRSEKKAALLAAAEVYANASRGQANVKPLKLLADSGNLAAARFLIPLYSEGLFVPEDLRLGSEYAVKGYQLSDLKGRSPRAIVEATGCPAAEPTADSAELEVFERSAQAREQSPDVPYYRVSPVYPSLLRDYFGAVAVEMELTVTDGGQVADARVLSAPHPFFEYSAMNCVRSWRFVPLAEPSQDPRVVRVTLDFKSIRRRRPAH